MMSLRTGDVDRIFRKLDMEIRETDHIWAYFRYDDKIVTKTRRSLGKGKIEGNIPFFIRQQLKLNEKEFRELLECEFEREGYIDILKSKKIINS